MKDIKIFNFFMKFNVLTDFTRFRYLIENGFLGSETEKVEAVKKILSRSKGKQILTTCAFLLAIGVNLFLLPNFVRLFNQADTGIFSMGTLIYTGSMIFSYILLRVIFQGLYKAFLQDKLNTILKGNNILTLRHNFSLAVIEQLRNFDMSETVNAHEKFVLLKDILGNKFFEGDLEFYREIYLYLFRSLTEFTKTYGQSNDGGLLVFSLSQFISEAKEEKRSHMRKNEDKAVLTAFDELIETLRDYWTKKAKESSRDHGINLLMAENFESPK